jgi:hypothetical protein
VPDLVDQLPCLWRVRCAQSTRFYQPPPLGLLPPDEFFVVPPTLREQALMAPFTLTGWAAA